MNVLTLMVAPFEAYDPPVLQLIPVVDEVNLVDLVAVYETERSFDVAGRYAGVIPTWFRYGSLALYYSGQPETAYWRSVGKVALLGCDCGEVGCWPLYAQIDADAAVVRWSRFEQPHRATRDYEEFGPFVFDRAQYDFAVEIAERTLRASAT